MNKFNTALSDPPFILSIIIEGFLEIALLKVY
jgi:hypothetical protein